MNDKDTVVVPRKEDRSAVDRMTAWALQQPLSSPVWALTFDDFRALALAAAPSTSVREEVEKLKALLKKERQRATDALYMRDAYRRMLGPKGQQVADAWDAAGLVRVHVSWGPDAALLDGEGIAQAHLDMAEAAKTGKPIEDVDGHIAALKPSTDKGGEE